MATIYYEITFGDSPFIVNIVGDSVDITETKWTTGTYYFTGLDETETYMITVSSSTGCIVEFEVCVDCVCATTTSTTTICDVYAEILSFCNIEEPPTTTTTSTTIIYSTVECLNGLEIEMIYIQELHDLGLLPEGYNHPCSGQIGLHGCNRALYEVFGDNVYLGDSRMNNARGSGGGQTSHSGNNICEDYHNTPVNLTGGLWEGAPESRYDKIIINETQAITIANSNGGDSIITFSFIPAMTTYGVSCGDETHSHSKITWVRIYSPEYGLLYNDCPEGNFFTLDICNPPTTISPLNTMFVYYNTLTTTTTLPD